MNVSMPNPHLLKIGGLVYSREYNRLGTVLDLRDPASSETQTVKVLLDNGLEVGIMSDWLNLVTMRSGCDARMRLFRGEDVVQIHATAPFLT